MGLYPMSLECGIGVVVQTPERLSLTPRPACPVKEMIRKVNKPNESRGRTLGTRVH